MRRFNLFYIRKPNWMFQKAALYLKGFSDKNLWRMKQFYETYKDMPKLSTVWREISWTNNLIILSRSQTTEERIFYLNACIREKYSKRELERQISSGLFERVVMGEVKPSPLVREIYPDVSVSFITTSTPRYVTP